MFNIKTFLYLIFNYYFQIKINDLITTIFDKKSNIIVVIILNNFKVTLQKLFYFRVLIEYSIKMYFLCIAI